MIHCSSCNAELADSAQFCHRCGSPVNALVPTNSVSQELIEQTRRFLRWEKKAWRITGTVYLIMGIAFAALCSLVALAGLVSDSGAGAAFTALFVVYAVMFGGMFIGIAIVNRVAAKKIDFYLNSIDGDFRPSYKRCTSVGMIVLCAIFNNVALIFYVINFALLKSKKSEIERSLN